MTMQQKRIINLKRNYQRNKIKKQKTTNVVKTIIIVMYIDIHKTLIISMYLFYYLTDNI